MNTCKCFWKNASKLKIEKCDYYINDGHINFCDDSDEELIKVKYQDPFWGSNFKEAILKKKCFEGAILKL